MKYLILMKRMYLIQKYQSTHKKQHNIASAFLNCDFEHFQESLEEFVE